ncbi:MAG: hypothetical protein J6J36_06855 [Clostridia bacterium]|nr:hypothetical protein [Clostridia bacterium]
MEKLKVKNLCGYYNTCGTITYTGFINNELVRIISYDKMKTGKAKESLIARYKNNHKGELVCEKI